MRYVSMRALQLRYYGILRGALMRLGQRFPDDICDGIRVSQCHLMIRMPSISERSIHTYGEEHVPCVLPQVPLSRSQNLIPPQTRHEAHLVATLPVCVVVVSGFVIARVRWA